MAPNSPDERKRQVKVNLFEWEKEELLEEAQKRGITVTDLIRTLLPSARKEHENGTNGQK